MNIKQVEDIHGNGYGYGFGNIGFTGFGKGSSHGKNLRIYSICCGAIFGLLCNGNGTGRGGGYGNGYGGGDGDGRGGGTGTDDWKSK